MRKTGSVLEDGYYYSDYAKRVVESCYKAGISVLGESWLRDLAEQ